MSDDCPCCPSLSPVQVFFLANLFKKNMISDFLYFQKRIVQTKHIKQNLAFSIKSCPVTLCWNNENLLFYSNFTNYLISLLKLCVQTFFVLVQIWSEECIQTTEFWIFLCALVLKCWNLCIRLCIECNRGRGFALSSEIHQDILSPRPPSLSYHISTSFLFQLTEEYS